jgi:glycolate oxidase
MKALKQKLSKLLGPACLADDPATLAAASGDKWFASHTPDIVVFPKTTGQVSKLLKFAHREKIPVTTRGAGVGYVGGCVPLRGGIVLALEKMNRIKEINAADSVAVVEPGVVTGVLQARARKRGLFYPPDPASLKECTLGGNIATNAGGPRCLKYGVTRHYVLGLEVVLADGRVLKTGSRTHKNKTGFDLVGLFTGSEGLLGVVTEATLRLLPLPPARATLSASFGSFRQTARAVQEIFKAGFLPSALEIADSFTLASARKFRGKSLASDHEAHLLIDLDGQRASVRSEMGELKKLLVKLRARGVQTALGEEACEALWELRRDFSMSLKATGLTKLNEDVAVPRGRLVDLVEFCERLAKKYGYPIACFGHAGDGNIHVNLMAADYHANPAVYRKVRRALDELFHQVLAWGGVITGEHGIGIAKQRWWRQAVPPAVRETHARIKAALDPNGILNPGKFVDLPGSAVFPAVFPLVFSTGEAVKTD